MGEKDWTVSKIRMLATLMVVALHISQHLERRIANLHYVTDWLNLGLVLFFTISGFLYSNRTVENEGKWLRDRLKKLIIPSEITVFFTILFYSVLIGKIGAKKIVFSVLAGLGLEAFLPEGWMFIQLWFLTYIFVCYASIPFIQKLDVKTMSSIAFWGMLCGMTFVLQSIGSVASILFGFPSLSWGVLLRFYLPYLLFRRFPIESVTCKRVVVGFSIVSAVLLAMTFFVRYAIAPTQGIIGRTAELLFIYTQTIAGTVLFYWLYQLLSKNHISRKVLLFSDQYSFPVYLTHCLFIGYSTSVIDRSSNVVVGVAFALICTMLSSLILNNLMRLVEKSIHKLSRE